MNKQLHVKQRLAKGFTLVELLIVVIILAILAAILVPQFASSTDDAKSSALDSTLSNMRGAIDLYYQQHGGRYPGQYKGSDGTTASAVGDVPTEFINQLSLYTDVNGKTNNAKTSVYKFGPYLKKDVLPANPITGINVMVGSVTGTLGMAGSGASQGWKYDAITGQFIANDTSADPSGTTYDKR